MTSTSYAESCLVDLDISPCEDMKLLQHYEYWLQMSLMTPDLHLVRAWSLCRPSKHEQFVQFGNVINGPVIYTWFELGRLPVGNTVQEIFTRGIRVYWPHFLLSAGTIDSPSNTQSRKSMVTNFFTSYFDSLS
jgi:hypothetical protein